MANGNTTQNKVKVRSQVIIDTLAALGYSFRLNELTQNVEVNGQPLSDFIAAKIRNDMRDMDFKGMDAIEDAYLAEAAKNSFHPIRDYFDSLTWDGLCHIAQLASYFADSGPVSPDGLTWFYRAFRHWLIGYVARVHGRTQLPMLVLEGPQRKGKSYFVHWLASILPDYFIEGPIIPDNKDCLLRLAMSFLWEVNELGATVRKADIEALKGFITLNNVTVRKPYGKRDLHLPATAGLIGTINDAGGFLNDSTGTRRTLVIPVTSIDWKYSQTVSVIGVWSEAVAAYRAGESANLTSDEHDTQIQINISYEVPNSVEDVLLMFFDIDSAHTYDVDWFTTANDLRQTVDIELKGTSQQHAIAIASTLKKLGAVRDKPFVGGKQIRGFWGVKRKSP